MLGQLFELLAFGTLVLLLVTQNVSANSDKVCTTKRCADTATMLYRNMDWGMLPCHNFYDFMCRNFHKWHPLELGQDEKSSFSIREEYVDEKLLKYLHDQRDNSPTAQKVRAFYQDCMDEATIEELGSFTVPLELNAIGLPVNLLFNPALVESYNLSRLLARLHRHAAYAKFIFDVNLLCDSLDATKNRLTIQYTRGLNNFRNDEWSEEMEVFAVRSHATSKEDEIKIFVRTEKEFMKKVVQHIGDITNQQFSKKASKLIESRIHKAVDFLEKLRETKSIENLENEPTRMTVVELQKKTDEILKANKSQININWLEYIETLFENIRDDAKQMFETGEPILVNNVKRFEAILKIVATVDQKVFVCAMWWIVARSVSAFASKELRRLYYDSEVQLYKEHTGPRQGRCLNVVKNEFPYILGAIMVHEDENAAQDQNKAIQMMSYLRRAYEDTIINSEWLDTGTKMAALNKLQYIKQSISVQRWMLMPSEIESGYHKKLVVRGQYFTTMRLLRRASRERDLADLGVDNDFSTDDGIPSGEPGEVNATYLKYFNGLQIPIGILGPPFYGLGLEALNYGAIGMVMGHELGHAFDNSGKDYNTKGVKKPWYKKRTKTEYGKRADCFIKSYNEIFIPEANQKVNGKLTLNENLADYLGFTHALKAYRMYVQDHGTEQRLPQFEYFSHEKLLTMAYANLYCENITPSFAKWVLENDVHSPGRARILGVLKNSEDFATIWNCKEGSAMNPADKCKLW